MLVIHAQEEISGTLHPSNNSVFLFTFPQCLLVGVLVQSLEPSRPRNVALALSYCCSIVATSFSQSPYYFGCTVASTVASYVEPPLQSLCHSGFDQKSGFDDEEKRFSVSYGLRARYTLRHRSYFASGILFPLCRSQKMFRIRRPFGCTSRSYQPKRATAFCFGTKYRFKKPSWPWSRK